jgi:hypothetical protein
MAPKVSKGKTPSSSGRNDDDTVPATAAAATAARASSGKGDFVYNFPRPLVDGVLVACDRCLAERQALERPSPFGRGFLLERPSPSGRGFNL